MSDIFLEVVTVLLCSFVGYWVVSLFISKKGILLGLFRIKSAGSEGTQTGSGKRFGEEKSSSYHVSEEEKYTKVLELSPPFDFDDVQSAYRRLIKKYHPDKVDHLGQEFKDIAEEKMVIINAAFDYFRVKLLRKF